MNRKILFLAALFLLLIAIPLTVYLAQKQQEIRSRATQKSKLGIQTSWERVQGDAVMNFIETAQPVVVKLLSGYNRATEIKQKSPSTFIVGRIYDRNYDDKNISDFVGRNPEGEVNNYLDSENKRNTIQNNPLIDCWEGPNEPAIFNDQAMTWYSRFEAERVRLLAGMGRRACIGNFSVGNPGDIRLWSYFLPAIRTAKDNNGYLALHEYSSPDRMNCTFGADGPSDEGWLTGRYRKTYRNYLNPNGLGDIRLIITETGIDGGTCRLCDCQSREGHQNDGWRSYTDASTYLNALRWYDDTLLKQDSYVIGATIFIYGRSDWNSFEIYPELTGGDGRTGPLTTYIAGGGAPPTPTPTGAPGTPTPTPTTAPGGVTLNHSCSPITLSANWNRGSGTTCNSYIQAGPCAHQLSTACTGSWSGTQLPDNGIPGPGCNRGLWHTWSGELRVSNGTDIIRDSETINCPPAAPTPTPTPIASAPPCDSSQLNMGVSPNPANLGSRVTFSLSGSQGSTWIEDSWSGGVDCRGTFWGTKICNAISGGNFTWTHRWKNCAPNNCNIVSLQCSKTASFSVVGSTPTRTPTPTSTPAPANLTFSIKFQGITQQRANKTVTLVLKQGTTERYRFNNLSITSFAGGVYTGIASNLLPGTYDLYIKGWAHLQKKFVNITLSSGNNTRDLISFLLKAGNLNTNNQIEIFDYNLLVSHFGPRMPAEGSLADLDLDNDVDIFDYSLLVTNFNQSGD